MLTSLVMRKIQTKTPVMYHSYQSEWLIKKSINSKCWRGHGGKGTFIHCLWEHKLVQSLEKIVRSFLRGFPGGSVVKNLPANAGDVGSIPQSGRSPGGGNGNPLQISCLENSTDRGAWRATGHGVAKSQTRLSD